MVGYEHVWGGGEGGEEVTVLSVRSIQTINIYILIIMNSLSM